MSIRRFGFIVIIGIAMVAISLVSAQSLDVDATNDILQQGERSITVGDLLLDERFDARDVWEFVEGDDGNARVQNGVYYMDRIQPELTMWAQNNTIHDNVVMIVDTFQTSDTDDNAFGMMCRASEENNASGYHLRISGDGFASIGLNQGDGMSLIAPWTRTPAINQGQQLNRLMVVCVDDYFAVYVNGELVVEVTDSTYSRGVAGFSVANFVEGSNVQVEFDNLEIYSASSAETGTRAGNGIRIVPRNVEETTSTSSEPTPQPAPIDFILANRGITDANFALSNNNSPVSLGEVLSTANFENVEENVWEIVNFKDDNVLFTTKVLGGRYVVYSEPRDTGFNEWAIDLENVIENGVIVATTEQISTEENNGYGIICRADLTNNGDGYYFRISGDGFYSLFVVEEGIFTALTEWTRSTAINTGQSSNTLVVVCVDDYLAFYANGELLVERTDSTFTRGTMGVNVVTYVSGEPIEIAYDDIVMIEASR